MSFMLRFVLGWILISSVSRGEVVSPTDVLIESRKGRVEFIKVISEVEGKVGSLPTKEMLIPYLRILPELSEIEKSYGFGADGQSLVASVGYAITNAYVKWGRIDEADIEDLKLFLAYASDGTKASLAEYQSGYVLLQSSQAGSMLFLDRAAWILNELASSQCEHYVVVSFEELQGFIVRLILSSREPLSRDQLFFIFEKAQGVPALSETAAVLRRMAGEAQSSAQVEEIVRIAFVFSQAVEHNPRSSMSLRGSPGDIVSDAIQRLINFGGNISAEACDQALMTMTPSAAVGFAGLLGSIQDRLLRRDRLEFFIVFGGGLLNKLRDSGMIQQSLNLEIFLNRMNILQRYFKKNFEGTYVLKTSRDPKALLTILHTGGRFGVTFNLFAGSTGDVQIPFSMFYVVFDPLTKTFKATQNPVDSAEFPIRSDYNTDLIFSVDEETGCVSGDFGYPAGQVTFSGCEREQVSQFSNEPLMLPNMIEDYSSIWVGTCKDQKVEFRISQVGPRIVGNWSFRALRYSIPLNYGIQSPESGSGVLTGGERDTGFFSQVRFRFLPENRLDVEFIDSGKGVRCRAVFTKTERGANNS